MDNTVDFESLTKAQQKQVVSDSGYDKEQLDGENPLFIKDSYFKEYAQELAEDIGAINTDAVWPNNCIDWDHAADELRMDYLSVEIDGQEYLFYAW